MRGEQDEALTRRRLEELARRCGQTGLTAFTDFLTPPEADWALLAARREGVYGTLDGGYADAERKIARFAAEEGCDEGFPITALRLIWPRQDAPTHRDILGSVMGLGLERHCIGDIAVEPEYAILFAKSAMAQHLRDNLLSAGRVRLQVSVMETAPEIQPSQTKEVRDTVASLRLDAVVAAGYNLSRAKAAALVTAGQVKLRHIPNEHVDAQVAQDDVISIRGLGRLQVSAVGQPTKKGRFPLVLLRYGDKRPS